tara:strand:+ start:35 stop:508 length:474 start_codon:yes stop_codon:yes gene_type:complete
MREVLSSKDKREAIKRYIALNPELSNRRIARYWDVGKTTVSRYRAQLSGPNGPENGQKVAHLDHPENENLPVVVNSNGQPYDEERIITCLSKTMTDIAQLERPIDYLESFRTFQLLDALMLQNQTVRNLNLYLDMLERATDFYRSIINERDSYFSTP